MDRAQNNWIGLYDTACQYYLKKDVSALNDNEWANTIAQLVWLRKDEARQNNNFDL